jgi:hypothetical protein
LFWEASDRVSSTAPANISEGADPVCQCHPCWQRRQCYKAGENRCHKAQPAQAEKGGRGVPDVAGDADPDSGYRIVIGGKTEIIGGTSAVAPLWAGITVLLNARRETPLGQPHAALYGAASAFRDITRGDNKSGTIGYVASKGWDACTGLGSPNGAKLVSSLHVTKT